MVYQVIQKEFLNNKLQKQKNSFISLKQGDFSPETTISDNQIQKTRSFVFKNNELKDRNQFQDLLKDVKNPFDAQNEIKQNMINNSPKKRSNKKFNLNQANRFSAQISQNELNFSFGDDSYSKQLMESPPKENKNLLNETFGEKNSEQQSEMSFENFNQDSSQFFSEQNNQYISFNNLITFNPKVNQDSSMQIFEAKKYQLYQLANFIAQNYQIETYQIQNHDQSMEIESRSSFGLQKHKSFQKYSNKFKFSIGIYYEKQNSNIIKQTYQLTNMICESTFSKIFSSLCLKTNKQVCIKRIKDQKETLDQSIFEIYILSYLKKKGNPNRYNFLSIEDFFYYNRHLYIVTEQLGDSLYQKYIKNKIKLSLKQIQIILKNIVYSMRFMKEVGIIHCDLKPENILLMKDKDNQAKIIDFGNAIFIDDNDVHAEMQTLPYRAPEITLEANYDYQIDIWSLGCIVYELITHKVLFNSQKPIENLILACSINQSIDLSVFKNIRNSNYSYKNFPINKKNIDSDVLEFIIPTQKFSLNGAIKRFYNDQQLISFVKQCLILDPEKRLTIEQAMSHPFFKKKYQQINKNL